MRVHSGGKAFDYQTLPAKAYPTFEGAKLGEVLATAVISDGLDEPLA